MLVDPTLTPAQSDADEAAHLRRLLERQPVVLMRVGVDGVLLAVSDAALSLFGANELKELLGRKLTDRIAPEHHDAWRDFAVRVWNTQSGSIECDMLDPNGAHRAVQMRAIALPDHPDGLHSLLIVVRDTTAAQRLEQTLQEHEAMRRVADDLSGKLKQACATRDQLQAALAQHDAAHKQALAEAEAEHKKLAAIVNERQVALQAQEKESQRAVIAMHGELERSLAEVRRLEEAITQATADRRQLITSLKQREAERQQLEKRIADISNEADEKRLVEAALVEARQARAEAEAALEQIRVEHEQFEALVKQREASRQRALAEHATTRMQAERALAEAHARNDELTNALAAQGLDLKNAAKHLEQLAQRFIKPQGTE